MKVVLYHIIVSVFGFFSMDYINPLSTQTFGITGGTTGTTGTTLRG